MGTPSVLKLKMIDRKAIDTMKSTIDAAALQADMARRFQLPGSITRRVNQSGRGREPRSGNIASKETASSTAMHCISCRSSNPHGSRICSSCGYFLHCTDQTSDTTLAERRGLVQIVPRVKAMIESEWDEVESRLIGNYFFTGMTWVCLATSENCPKSRP